MARSDDKCGVKKLSFNVPVVYDVFAARISETAGFAGLQKCGYTKHHKGRSSALRAPDWCFV
jgi:hypothetical protein